MEIIMKKHADKILYDFGLLEKLNEYGKPHIIGSYRMDLMAWNDLDIDIENDDMSLEKLYSLSNWIIGTFHPTWYEAKEELKNKNEKIWFHGFETLIDGKLWNVDLWFFDKQTIFDAEEYCDSVSAKINAMPDLKDIIIKIKKELLKRNMYSFEQFSSMDVYDAVLNGGVTNVEKFIKKCSK